MTRGAVPAFLSYALLLYALRGIDVRRARAVGFLWEMVAYGAGLPWLWELFHASAIALWATLALFVAFFAWMQSLAWARGVTGWRWAAFTMVNWTGWEFIRAELFPLKFPWMTPGVASGPNWLLPWIGVYGVSAAVVLLAAWVSAENRLPRKVLWLALSVAFMASLGPGWLPEAGLSRPVRVALVQDESGVLGSYQDKTTKFPAGVQLVIWPEYAVPYDLRANHKDMAEIQHLCEQRGVVMVIGTQTVSADKKGWFNTALTLDASGPLGEHHKVHTVHFFDDGIPGTTALPVKTPLGLMGTPICFDCDYEGPVRQMTVAGAEYFAVPSMDAVSWSARQHEQHAALFRLRACENGRWMAVCASSGVSQISDPGGGMHENLPPLAIGELLGMLNRETGLTFFTCWGWLVPWYLLGTAVFCWVAILPWRGRRR